MPNPLWSVIFSERVNTDFRASIYLFRDTRIMCEICSKLTVETPERRQWRLSSLPTLNRITHFSDVFNVDFEQVNDAGWVMVIALVSVKVDCFHKD